jgi:hypothetical protein
MAGVLACGWLLWGSPGAAAHQDLEGDDRAAALRTFTEGVERYAALRARYAVPLPPFDPASDPWSLKLSRHFLAAAIRTARRTAGLGDIFTPPVARMFHDDIGSAIYALDVEGLVDEGVVTRDFTIDLIVNEPLPAWAMETVPDTLLARLPPLPPAIEYRIVGESLVLWDADAEILIDALPDVLVIP